MSPIWIFIIVGAIVIVIGVILLLIGQSPPLLTITLQTSQANVIGNPPVPDGTFLALCGSGKVPCQQNLVCAVTHQDDQRCLLSSGEECLFNNQCAGRDCIGRCR